MKRAVTLIELIFSIVIIALVFTIIPKIVVATTQSSIQERKEMAMVCALAWTKVISRSFWDENSTEYDASNDITIVKEEVLRFEDQVDYNCSQEGRSSRVGSFHQVRKCDENRSISQLGIDGIEARDDVDDFMGSADEEFLRFCDENFKNDYEVNVAVDYVKDPQISSTTKLSKDKTNGSNTKRVVVKVGFKKSSKKANLQKSDCIATFHFQTFNVGYVDVKQ